MNPIYIMMALAAGAGFAAQSAINSRLSLGLGNVPVAAALVSFAVGAVALLVLAIWLGQLGTQTLFALTERPWWQFLGGLLGAFLVFCSVFLAGRIGVAPMFLLIILAQFATVALIDHFGWFGMPIRSLSIYKICGLLLLLGGVVLYIGGDKYLK